MHSRRTTTVSHTAVCAMVDLGKQPARWPCLLRLLRPLASPYDVELLRSTLVARPAVHRNLLSRLRAIAAQIPRKRRQCRTLAPLAREAVVATWATILAGSIAFTRARISRFRAALPPRGRWQEVASSIRARPGLPGRWAGAPATGPGRWPWRTRGGARRRPKPRQNRSTAWVSGARIDWARSSLRKNGQGGSQPRGGPRGARRACGRAPGAIKS